MRIGPPPDATFYMEIGDGWIAAITEAWLLVLDYYHDVLPPPLQWRPGQKCPGCMDPKGHWFSGVNDDGPIIESHDIPAPALTDAAALAVLRVLNEQTNWDTISKAIDATGVDYEGDIRDAIILAAAELAQKERAK